MSILLPALFSFPFLALGYFCLRTGKADLALGRASRQWLPISATVQSLTHLHAGDYGSGGGYPGLKHHFYVRYAYDFAGKRHWGDWKSPAARPLEKARTLCPLAVGGPMTVYYCPQNPERSVVERGLTIQRMLLTLAGIVFLVVPLPLTFVVSTAVIQK